MGAERAEIAAAAEGEGAEGAVAALPPDSAAAPDVPPELGAYLVFDPVSNGTMFQMWSKVKVDGALLFGRPYKKVPEFRFAKGGKWEIKRNIQRSKQTYYLACAEFVKNCLPFECTFLDLALTSGVAPIPVS